MLLIKIWNSFRDAHNIIGHFLGQGENIVRTDIFRVTAMDGLPDGLDKVAKRRFCGETVFLDAVDGIQYHEAEVRVNLSCTINEVFQSGVVRITDAIEGFLAISGCGVVNFLAGRICWDLFAVLRRGDFQALMNFHIGSFLTSRACRYLCAEWRRNYRIG